MHYCICVGNKLHDEVFRKTNMTSTSVRLFRAIRENCVRAKTTCRNELISNNYKRDFVLIASSKEDCFYRFRQVFWNDYTGYQFVCVLDMYRLFTAIY